MWVSKHCKFQFSTKLWANVYYSIAQHIFKGPFYCDRYRPCSSTLRAGCPQLSVNDTSVRYFLHIVVSSPGACPKYHNQHSQQSVFEVNSSPNDNQPKFQQQISTVCSHLAPRQHLRTGSSNCDKRQRPSSSGSER